MALDRYSDGKIDVEKYAMAFYLRAGWIGGETGEEADTGPWQRLHSPPDP